MNIRNSILITAVLALLVPGCRGGRTPQLIEISCDDFYQENFITENFTLETGQEITILLCSNPSTGFQWSETPQREGPELLSLDSHRFTDPGEEGADPPPGTPGIEIWNLTAIKSGQTRLFFQYSQNWEGGEQTSWSFTLDLTVQ